MAKISITRALAELKLLDKRIDAGISSSLFVSAYTADGYVIGVKRKKEDIEEEIKAGFASIKALMERRKAIKSGIMKSNSESTVSIGGNEMTVADAIEMKNTLHAKENWLVQLRGQYNRAAELTNRQNAMMQQDIEKRVALAFGSDKTKQPTPEQINSITDVVKANSEAFILEPVQIAAFVDKLQKEVDMIKTEIDFTLSESNARTEIEIPD